MYEELQLKACGTELDQAIKKHELRYIRLYDLAFECQGVAAEEVIDRPRDRGNREFARIMSA